MNTVRTERGCKFTRWLPDSLPPPTYVKAVGFYRQGRSLAGVRITSCRGAVLQWTGALDTGKGALRKNQNQPGFHLRLFPWHHAGDGEHLVSIFWSAGNGYRTDEPQATVDLYKRDLPPPSSKDVDIMANQQARIDMDPYRPLLKHQGRTTRFITARRAFMAAYEAEQAGKQQAAE